MLGQCIAASNDLRRRGSTGLYLRFSTNCGKCYADYLITCRHVLIRNENTETINPATAVEPITNYNDLIQVLQPANHEEVKNELDRTARRLRGTIQEFRVQKGRHRTI